MSAPVEPKPARARRPRLLLIGSVVYLALIFGVMLWRGVSIEPEWVLLVLLVIAVALGRGRTFIADWTPFLLLFLAYEAMRGFAAKTNFQPHDLSGLERWVFAGTIPTLVLQHDFYHPGVVGVQDIAAMLFYFMHFVLPIVVGFIFWVTSREYYWRFVAALLLMCFLAFVTYLFWPSAPPWYQLHDVVKINDQTVRTLWGFTLVTPLYHSFNPNAFAAFPSLHAAFPMLAAVYAWERYRLLAAGLVLWSAAVILSIVYLGEHYVVDALVSVFYVAAATIIVETVSRRRARAASATPATPSA
ncbi:MAG TPA: phosphatase PAP2 family protein [Candidatus Dormibacteraeota bacterium]